MLILQLSYAPFPRSKWSLLLVNNAYLLLIVNIVSVCLSFYNVLLAEDHMLDKLLLNMSSSEKKRL